MRAGLAQWLESLGYSVSWGIRGLIAGQELSEGA